MRATKAILYCITDNVITDDIKHVKNLGMLFP